MPGRFLRVNIDRSIMCGRYTLQHSSVAISHRFALGQIHFDWTPRYNIAPSQLIPVIWNQDGLRHIASHRWGLVPFWAKDPSTGSQSINARAETLQDRASFRQPFQRRRCLIPADAFYEWTGPVRSRQPVCIRRLDAELFAFAGLWDEWRPPDGPPLRTAAIVTVPPNSLLSSIHNRMPAILRPEHEAAWLAPDAAAGDLISCLQPYPSEWMEWFPVSRRVNSPAHDDPECMAREAS